MTEALERGSRLPAVPRQERQRQEGPQPGRRGVPVPAVRAGLRVGSEHDPSHEDAHRREALRVQGRRTRHGPRLSPEVDPPGEREEAPEGVSGSQRPSQRSHFFHHHRKQQQTVDGLVIGLTPLLITKTQQGISEGILIHGVIGRGFLTFQVNVCPTQRNFSSNSGPTLIFSY